MNKEPNILFVHSKYDPIGLIIRFCTKSYWNHVGWIINNSYIIESSKGGIVISPKDKYKKGYVTKALPIKDLTPDTKIALDINFIERLQYVSYIKKFMTFVCIWLQIDYKWLLPGCSGLIAIECEKYGIKFADVPSKFITPEHIYQKLNIGECIECPNCHRIMPNTKHRRRQGCKWCVPLKNTKYCDGNY